MAAVGTVESLWRYPVKSMGGEELNAAFMGFAGFYGDRCYAFMNSAARKGTPYLTASTQPQMLRYQPRFRYPERTITPPNLLEAMSIAPGITPANGEPGDMVLDVITPAGDIIAVDDPMLMDMLCDGLRGQNHLKLVHSDRALTDCRPVSLISKQTIGQVESELDVPLDKRRFRANIYLNLSGARGFAEDEWVGRKLRIGATAEVEVLERDPRCMMISLDPETAEHNPKILRNVAQTHANLAGVYCAVLVEGVLRKGDPVELC